MNTKNMEPGAAIDRVSAHIGLLFETDDEFYSVVLAYVRQGLERNERVICVVDGRSEELVESRLRAACPETAGPLADGQILVFSALRFPERCGIADADCLFDLFREELDASLAAGYAGMRVAVEMSWALRDGDQPVRALEFESRIELFTNVHPVNVICLYDRRVLGGIAEDAMMAHPHVSVDGVVTQNCFYEPPGNLVSGDIATARLRTAGNVINRVQRLEEQVHFLGEEKNAVLKEVHHRVKNNMQVICSLLSLQSRALPEGECRAAMRDAQSRIKSMALVHEKLYCSRNLSCLNLKEYIENFSYDIHRAYHDPGKKVSLGLRCDDVSLGVDQAVPCGLILNELFSNCYKHAFDPGSTGTISVSLSSRDGMVRLTVRDNGKGMPDDIDPSTTDSMGLMLVSTLAAQLDATLEFVRGRGTEVRLSFMIAPRALRY